MKALLRATLLLAALCGSAGPSVAEEGYADHYRSAIAAYQEGDAQAFLDSARNARALRPDSPQAAYLLAAAAAMNNQPAESLELLQSLAGQGLQFKPAEEAAFAILNLAEKHPALLQAFESHGMPAGEARVEWRLEEDRFVPEGIAWDGERQRLLLGSIHQSRILAVAPDRDSTVFVESGRAGLLSVFGMRVGQETGSLWVATSGMRETRDIEENRIGRAGIFEFDLGSGAFRRAFWLPDDGQAHVLGDLELMGDGIATTDSLTGAVYVLNPADGQYRVVLPPGQMVSPQGLAPALEGDAIYLADYRGGLFRLDLANGNLSRLKEGGTTHHGIDGLYRAGRWLVAIQNGIRPHRVVALRLNDAGDSVIHHQVLAAALQEFEEPTLGTFCGDRFCFIANSHWPSFDENGRLPDGLSGPVVMSVALPGASQAGRR